MTIKKTAVKKLTTTRKNAVIKKAPKKDPTNPNSKFTNKSPAEKEEIKSLVSIGLRKCKSVAEINQLISNRGLKVATATLYQYIKDVREEWQQNRVESYEAHLNAQIAKLDLYESELWKRYETTKDVAIIISIVDKIWVRRNEILGISSSTINVQNNITTNNVQNNVVQPEGANPQGVPINEKFFGNFIIEVDPRGTNN